MDNFTIVCPGDFNTYINPKGLGFMLLNSMTINSEKIAQVSLYMNYKINVSYSAFLAFLFL